MMEFLLGMFLTITIMFAWTMGDEEVQELDDALRRIRESDRKSNNESERDVN